MVSAPPVELIVQAHLDHIEALGDIGLYRKNKTGGNIGQAQQMRGAYDLGAKIEVVVLDEGGPAWPKRIFHACAKRPSCPRLGRVDGRYAGDGVIPTHDVERGCQIHTVLAALPSPTTLCVDQCAINCCANSTRDCAKARNLAITGKTDTRGTNCTCIEATSAALYISPMNIGLDSENGPPGLPISSELAPGKPTTHGVRSLGPAKLREGSSVLHLGRDRGQRCVLIPAVLFVPPAGTATDAGKMLVQLNTGRGTPTGVLTSRSAAPATPVKPKASIVEKGDLVPCFPLERARS